MFRFVFTLLVLMLVTYEGFGQTKLKQETSNKIYSYLQTLEDIGFYGSVLVARNGELILSEGYGFSNAEDQINNSPTAIFDIGSITKQFTAAAILKLEMEGKLSTEDNISKYFDNVPLDKEQITIHDLLRHQSGLISNVGKDYEKINEGEFLNKVFTSKLKFETGTNFSYSNIGYSLLAMIIEKVSKQSYETYLYEHIWKPAKMEMTGYTRPAFDTNQIAVGYFRNDLIWGKPTHKEWDDDGPYWHLKGNGGLLSTTEDLYKWHKILMTKLVLSKGAKRKLYRPKLRPEENANGYYAYGWDVSQTSRKTTQIWHNGTNNIFYADFLRFPEENTVVILLTNKLHPNFEDISFEIARIIFDQSYIPEIPAEDNDVNRNFTNRIIKTIQEFGLEKAKVDFQKRKNSEQLLEFEMRNKAFEHLDNRDPAIAIQIFEMNVVAHPNSYKALQGLAEGYFETGEKEMALLYFKASQRINPDNPFVNHMIKTLEEK